MKINPVELDRWIERSDDMFDDDPYLEKIYDEGWSAFEEGKSEADVPFKPHKEEFDIWLDGFRDAKTYNKLKKG